MRLGDVGQPCGARVASLDLRRGVAVETGSCFGSVWTDSVDWLALRWRLGVLSMIVLEWPRCDESRNGKRREETHGLCETNKDNSLRLHVHSPTLILCVSKRTAAHSVAEQGWPIARLVFYPRVRGRDVSTRSDHTRHLEATTRM
jgi:hypothetical protein